MKIFSQKPSVNLIDCSNGIFPTQHPCFEYQSDSYVVKVASLIVKILLESNLNLPWLPDTLDLCCPSSVNKTQFNLAEKLNIDKVCLFIVAK